MTKSAQWPASFGDLLGDSLRVGADQQPNSHLEERLGHLRPVAAVSVGAGNASGFCATAPA